MPVVEGRPQDPPIVHPLLVVYGSETGTAQEVAGYVAALARRRGFAADARPLDSIPVPLVLGSPLTVFVVSTTGDGEVPTNMTAFWRYLLRRSLPPDALKGMCFAVFGLGDSGYDKYNATARKLHARLLQLGGSELAERGLGDDQSPRGMWGDLDPWLSTLWSNLLRLRPLPKGAVVDDTPRLEPPRFSVTPVEAPASAEEMSSAMMEQLAEGRTAFWEATAPPARGAQAYGCVRPLELLVNRRLTATDHFQDVRHLEFELSGASGAAKYAAGDVAWVHPSNSCAAVETLARLTGLELRQLVRISPTADLTELQEQRSVLDWGGTVTHDNGSSGGISSRATVAPGRTPSFLPSLCDVEFLLTEVLDILGTPRRCFFERLSLFAANPDERDKLRELASSEGADLLYEYATREKRSYVEVLEDFPSCKLPLERLVEIVPPLRPRGFSIASSALETPGKLQVCVAVVSFRTPYKRRRTGVCSSWLASLSPGAQVPISIRPGTFKLPSSPDHPLLMVGPGTGVAPMRSVILDRRHKRRASRGSENPRPHGRPGSGDGVRGQTVTSGSPPDTLFFGCRYRDKDFYYEKDWAALSETGELSLHTAFSREGADGARIYVQRRLREQADSVASLIVDQGANVLVSGSAKQMPRDVRRALVEAVSGHEKVGGDVEAEKVLKAMERQGRYCVEAWS